MSSFWGILGIAVVLKANPQARLQPGGVMVAIDSLPQFAMKK